MDLHTQISSGEYAQEGTTVIKTVEMHTGGEVSPNSGVLDMCTAGSYNRGRSRRGSSCKGIPHCTERLCWRREPTLASIWITLGNGIALIA